MKVGDRYRLAIFKLVHVDFSSLLLKTCFINALHVT